MTPTTFRSVNEAPRGFNHRFVITASDLTVTTADTPQSITLVTLPAGTVVKQAAYFLKTPFKDADDAAFNSTALTVGDSGDADRYIDSAQLNENGTEIIAGASNGSKVPFAYASSTAVVAAFASMAAKDLADLDTGEIWIYLETADLTSLT